MFQSISLEQEVVTLLQEEKTVFKPNIEDQVEGKLLEDAPAERRERPLRSDRPEDRWERGNAPLCAVG